METDNIELLKEEVGRRFGRGIESATDFDALSLDILSATSENISSSTLKRIFGYVRYDAAPRVSTLSILARYVGCLGWEDFCARAGGCGGDDGGKSGWAKRVFVVAGILLAAALAGVFLFRPAVSAPPVKSDLEIIQDIRVRCIQLVRDKVDSVMALKGSLPLYRYADICDSTYREIVFSQIQPLIDNELREAFPGKDSLQLAAGNQLYIECRECAMQLTLHITQEERRQALMEKAKALYPG